MVLKHRMLIYKIQNNRIIKLVCERQIARNMYNIKYLYNKLEHKRIRVIEENPCIYFFDSGKNMIYVAKYSVWESLIYGFMLEMITQCYKGMTSVKYGTKWTFRVTSEVI